MHYIVLSAWFESLSHTSDASEISLAFKARLQTCQVRPASGHSASGDASLVPKDCMWRWVGVFSWQTKRFVITGHLLGMFPPNPVKIHLTMCFLRDLSSKKAIGRLAIWLYQRVSSPKDSRGMINWHLIKVVLACPKKLEPRKWNKYQICALLLMQVELHCLQWPLWLAWQSTAVPNTNKCMIRYMRSGHQRPCNQIVFLDLPPRHFV